MSTDPPSGRRVPVGLLVVGSEMAAFTILGVVLDFALGTMPGFTIGLTILGVGVAFWHLVKLSKTLGAKKPDPREPPEGSP